MHTCIPDHLSPPYHIGHNTAQQMGISRASDHACCSARHNRAFTEIKTEMQQFDHQVFHELCPLLVCILHMHIPIPYSCPCVGKARRTNSECSRSLEKGCVALSNYRCCCVKRVCMEEQYGARYAPTGKSSKVSLEHWL